MRQLHKPIIAKVAFRSLRERKKKNVLKERLGCESSANGFVFNRSSPGLHESEQAVAARTRAFLSSGRNIKARSPCALPESAVWISSGR